MIWQITFFVDFFAQIDRSRRDLSFYNQSSLDRYHFESDGWYKMMKICTLYALIFSISRNRHPYPLFYVDVFTLFDRSRRDLSFYNQSSLDRYHFERDGWYKMMKTCTLYTLIFSISRNRHAYLLFYVDFFAPFDRSRRDLSFDMQINKDDRSKNT